MNKLRVLYFVLASNSLIMAANGGLVVNGKVKVPVKKTTPTPVPTALVTQTEITQVANPNPSPSVQASNLPIGIPTVNPTPLLNTTLGSSTNPQQIQQPNQQQNLGQASSITTITTTSQNPEVRTTTVINDPYSTKNTNLPSPQMSPSSSTTSTVTETIQGSPSPQVSPVLEPVVVNANETATEGALQTNVPNEIFRYTHLLASPLNFPQGTAQYGTSTSYSFLDFLQVGTNMLRNVTGHFNANVKVPTIEFPTFITSLTLGWEWFNLQQGGKENPDERRMAWTPGFVSGFEMGKNTAMFFGLQFNMLGDDSIPSGLKSSGYFRGARAEWDLSYMYNPKTSRLASNTVSIGLSYDFSYKNVGIGFTHHWPTFDLGIHFVSSANQYKVEPVMNVIVGI